MLRRSLSPRKRPSKGRLSLLHRFAWSFLEQTPHHTLRLWKFRKGLATTWLVTHPSYGTPLFRTLDEFITRICTRALICFFMVTIGNLSTISCLRLAQITVRFEFALKARSACQSTRTTACTWQCQPATLCSTHRRFTNTTRIRRFWLLVITC